MRGLLILVSASTSEDHDLPTAITPINLLAESDGGFERYDTTADEALGHLKGLERANVEFDIESAGSDGQVDQLEMEMHRANLAAIDALAWPAEPDAQGHYVLDSVWALGLDEDGMQYRFVPIAI